MASYGYSVQSGYMGRLPDGRWMMFATHKDYLEYIEESDHGRHNAV